MRPPLNQMVIRTPVLEKRYTSPGTSASHVRQPFGGGWGPDVRVADGKRKPHQGWDLYADPGTPIYAICDGGDVFVENNPDNATKLGRYLTFEFTALDPRRGKPGMFWALYAHLSVIQVHPRARVREGQVLGVTGVSGNAKGGPPHLHFGVLRWKYPKPGTALNEDPGYFIGFQYMRCDLGLPTIFLR